MGLLRKIIFGFGALFFIFFGGAGTQSDSTILQGGGFLGILLGFIVLFVFTKMAWRAMGCLPSLIVMLAVVFFILYAIGAFSNGLTFEAIEQNLQSFLGQGVQTSQDVIAETEEIPENKADDSVVNLVEPDAHPIFTENIKDRILPQKKVQKKQAFNPMKYPAVYGVTRVLSGDTMTMNGRVIKLFGIAAPDISQTCADASGRGYRCGQQSIAWLSDWLADNEVECHIISEDERGVLTGVCLLGPYDIGAALTNAGWAVADTRQTQIYRPYQQQAVNNRRGLWQGNFYMPWDWKKIQGRKANIKVIKKNNSTSRRKVWFNPFGD